MKKAAAGIFAALATVAFAGGAHAQIVPNLTPFSVEVRGGASIPTGTFKDNFKTGYTTSANVTFHALPVLGIYGGYSLNGYDVKDAAGGGSVREQGFDAGVRVDVPTPLIPIDPFIRAGAVYHKLKETGTTSPAETDNKLGFEVGAGVAFALGPKVSVTPAVSYTKISDVEVSGVPIGLDISHVRADIGIRIRI
ncbi:MAG TPA: outer membrane beta-barrel protein [Longimicrobiaceae bacterium]|jgi:opacity protein-like surface antigen|nr:outer membrane beta-barrel protein [Longimicrobiaceae bacterium]